MSFFNLHIYSISSKMVRANTIDYRIINVSASGLGLLRLNNSWRLVVGRQHKSFLLRNINSNLLSYSMLSRQHYFLPTRELAKFSVKHINIQSKFDPVEVKKSSFQIKPIFKKTRLEFAKVKLKFHHFFNKSFQK